MSARRLCLPVRTLWPLITLRSPPGKDPLLSMTAPPSSASAGREGGQPSARPLHDFSTRKCTLPRLRDVEKGFRHGEGSACRAAAPLMKSSTSSSSMSRSDVLPGLSFNSYVYAGGRVWGGLLRGRKDRRSAPTTRRPCTAAVVTAGMCVCVRQPGMWLCPSVLSRRDNKLKILFCAPWT